ncbi:Aldehyde ferredoxin oxidoreductase [Ferroglobus placidus DSM 10642]|uniref:Aldehyde ferredoxin oxidoreductase n=1 Tax=Ferroglobus placidus (strain DSM 10642 / AEDII12DO) TaxID=589924 RepID=D3RY98_FERPA|nr:aldehyde ferredoxin oxidoreductase N-terminal domain-containing protein [Ferroglobus placidus]ADC65461.1 Aldehyde ferredoxin oxidoreductase [Ferroglobus placidus DSM 10642]
MSFTSKLLEIDLSEERWEEVEIDSEAYERNLGIIGIAYEIAEKLAGRFSPFDEDNFVIFAAGILTNTSMPGASKVVAVTKNPLNNTYGPSVGGGAFARDMKRAGYDLIVIKGRAEKPVWIDISEGKVEVNEAKFWGRDAVESYELLKEKGKSVLTIGQAGENLVSYALTLIDGVHHLGKAGLGAVLGSKNLKAIRVGGSKKSRIADENKFDEVVKAVRKKILSDKVTKLYAEVGIMAAWENWAKFGYLANKMKSEAISKEVAEEFGVKKYLEKIKVRSLGCFGCPSPCKAVLKAKINGKEIVTKASLYLGVAYEFGVKCGVKKAEEAVFCHDLANRFGIDAMLFAELFDVLATLKEEGKIDLEIKRDFDSVVRFLKLVAERKEVGEKLAKGIDGVKEIAEFEDYFIKKMEPLFDPRVSSGSEAFGLLTNPRGAQEGPVTPTVLPGRSRESLERYMRSIGASEELIRKTFENGFNSALYTLAAENWLWTLNGMGICRRESIARSLNIETVKDLFVSATGIEASSEDIVKAAARAFTICRKLNCSEGYSMKDDLPPKRFFQPLKTWEGEKVWRDYLTGKEIKFEDVVKMLKEYYRFRGWKENGCP